MDNEDKLTHEQIKACAKLVVKYWSNMAVITIVPKLLPNQNKMV